MGRIGYCNRAVGVSPISRFRFSCLFCRWRRWYYRGYRKPGFWMEYAYVNVHDTYFVEGYLVDGRVLQKRGGGRFLVHRRHTVLVDPRGHFLGWRMAAIRVLDSLMGVLRRRKPLIEFCEFLANYPVW